MKICSPHWKLCIEAVTEKGLMPLTSKNGEELAQRLTDSLDNPEELSNFDPLFSLGNHFTCEALRHGGLYLMGENQTGENEGQFCPICEFVKHAKDFDAKKQIDTVAGQMAAWARDKGLITKVQ